MTPEYPPEAYIHQKTQNIQKLLPETRYRVREGISNQYGGEALARIQSLLDRLNINTEIKKGDKTNKKV
jgi:hypothetical protein